MSVLKKASQWGAFARTWHLYDCKWQDPFQSAEVVKKHLMGLHKPIYHPLADCGDHVVCINTAHIALRGEEWTRRVYFHHTQYAGGATWTLAHDLHRKDNTKVQLNWHQTIMYYAIYKSMKGNLQRRHTMHRLLLFPDANVPKHVMDNISNQLRQTRVVPKALHEYDEEELKNFPKIMDYPKNYVVE